VTTPSPGLELLGGIALLLWSTRLIRTGVERAFGERLRRVLAAATGNRFRAAGTGVAVAAALQSAAATTVLVSSFASRGLVALPMALALVIGADVGSTLVVKLLAFDVKGFAPVLLAAGFALFTWAPSSRWRNIGRAVIGLGLVMVALAMIVGATEPLRGDWLVPLIFQRLQDQPGLALIIAAGLTFAVQSSVAVVLLVMALAGTGAVPPALGVVLVVGANIGAAFIPLWMTWTNGPVARRVALGNLAFRGITGLSLLPFAPLIVDVVGHWARGPALVADAHVIFNLLVAAIWLPLVGWVARLAERIVPEPAAEDRARASHLDEAALATPAIALGCAAREALAIADKVETMLREVILAFEPEAEARVGALRKLDDEVDRAQEAIKLYLTRLTRQPLSEADGRKAFDLILFATNLEHVGDIIDKNLLDLAAKKHRLKTAFSEEGWAELKAMHERAVAQARLAVTVFVTRDEEMARQLVVAKDAVRAAERAAADSHLKRLTAGKASSIETSSLHLDILRDLKRIVAHLTDVAYPILEASGRIRQSRLA
jgi:phosphate:Na+ symporter